MSPLLQPLETRQLFSVLLDDSFSGRTLNDSLWGLPAWDPGGSTFLGQTQLRVSDNQPLPPVSKGAVHLRLDTYNPTASPGNPSFFGTELITNKRFKLGKAEDAGLELIVRAKLKGPTTPGIVGGLFFYDLKPASKVDSTLHDELDFELLGNQATAGTNQVQTNIYANEPLGAGSPVFVPLPGGKLTGWHTYKIRWTKLAVKWYIDGHLARTLKSTAHPLPTGPTRLHLNLWAPAADWAEAYSPTIQPTADPGENQHWTADIDRVTVKSIKA